jgi:membrane protein required for colicin V production
MTLFDAGVVGIVLLLGLICFALGFTRVILGIGGWVGGLVAAWLGFPYVQPIARAHIGIALVADIVAGFALFVVALIVINLFTHAIARAVRGSPLRALDKSLGLVLGLGIGAVGVCVAFLLLNPLAKAEGGAPPVWMQKSRTLPLIEWGGQTLRALLPSDMRGKVPTVQHEEIDMRDMERRWLSPGTKAPAPGAPGGAYTEEQRRSMDRLFEGQR